MPIFTIKSGGYHSGSHGYYATGDEFSQRQKRKLSKLSGNVNLDFEDDRRYVHDMCSKILKERLVIKMFASNSREERMYDLLHRAPRSAKIDDHYQWNSEYTFHRWAEEQLKPSGKYFGIVHVIVDNHLRDTAKYWDMYIDKGYSEVYPKLQETSDICFNKIRPIYEMDIAERQQQLSEYMANKTVQDEVNTEATKHIEDGNIKMAVEDLDRYILGHKSLIQHTPPS